MTDKTGAFRDCWNCDEGVQMITSSGEYVAPDYCPNCEVSNPCGDKPAHTIEFGCLSQAISELPNSRMERFY